MNTILKKLAGVFRRNSRPSFNGAKEKLWDREIPKHFHMPPVRGDGHSVFYGATRDGMTSRPTVGCRTEQLRKHYDDGDADVLVDGTNIHPKR